MKRRLSKRANYFLCSRRVILATLAPGEISQFHPAPTLRLHKHNLSLFIGRLRYECPGRAISTALESGNNNQLRLYLDRPDNLDNHFNPSK